jgi:hypothetical protein
MHSKRFAFLSTTLPFATLFPTQIPALDVKHPPESYSAGALVRFRAMVQDTSPSPEMYLSKLEGNKCGGWGITNEVATEDVDYSNADLQECTVIWAVSVPGETQNSSGELDRSIISSASTCTKQRAVIFH